MSYRGEDLDLRTPQTWSVTGPEPAEPYANGARGRNYGRAVPILVDDVVLACSNHAFDVAVAHRASEVRIEHLLHAMTRIDGASHTLEARGIRVAGLRRESATVIAGEIPIGVSAGQGRPRRSDDFEQVLRTASAIAYRRNAPANIDDLLDALLEMPSDVPGIALLARHGGRIVRERTIRDSLRERTPLPPLPSLSRSTATYSSDLREPDTRRETVKTYYTEPQRDLRPLAGELIGTPVDSIQNARIDQLEAAVRALTAELSNERNTIATLVQDLNRSIKAERDDTNRFRGGLHERLQSLEQVVQSSSADDRLDQRLNELARPWGVLSDRLQALEQTILETRDQGHDAAALQDRIAGLERSVREFGIEGSRASGGLHERLKGLERAIDLTPIASRLDIIEEAVLTQDGHKTNEELAGRLRTIEDSVRGLAGNADRLRAMEDSLRAQAAANERLHNMLSERLGSLAAGLSPLHERMQSLYGGLVPLNERIGQVATAVDGRMQALAGLVDRQRSELAQPIIDRVSNVGAAVDARGAETARTLAGMAERIAALELKLNASAQKADEALAAHTAELKDVHDALIKLNANQHTLAGSIDQWRLDGVGDISVIANRLETIESASAKPVQMIEALTASVDKINKVTVERYHRRNRFWYWLFGTDDWLTASWPSQVAAVEAEQAALRTVAPLRSGSVPQRPQR